MDILQVVYNAHGEMSGPGDMLLNVQVGLDEIVRLLK